MIEYYKPTPDDLEVFEEIKNASSFIPCDVQSCINKICYYISNNYTTTDNKRVDFELISEKYFSYLAWHNSKYPQEQYAPKEHKLKSLFDFLEERLWQNEYKIEIKEGAREKYLFGENIYLLNKKLTDFKEKVNGDYYNIHGKSIY